MKAERLSGLGHVALAQGVVRIQQAGPEAHSIL